MENPQCYRYDLDLASVTEVWRRGSVISSWLLDLTARAFVEALDLPGFSGRVSDSGKGRRTAIAAIEVGVPAPVIAALSARFDSRDLDPFANQVLSAMRPSTSFPGGSCLLPSLEAGRGRAEPRECFGDDVGPYAHPVSGVELD